MNDCEHFDLVGYVLYMFWYAFLAYRLHTRKLHVKEFRDAMTEKYGSPGAVRAGVNGGMLLLFLIGLVPAYLIASILCSNGYL